MQADLILTGGVVYTVDARRSRHEALAVKGGRIVALGSAAEAAEWAGPRTRTVDLGGRLVLPGFVDAHLHPSFATVRALRGPSGGLPVACRSAWTGWRASPRSTPSCRPSAAAAGLPPWSPWRG